MARCYSLHLQILCGIACELQDFGGEIFENRGDVHGSFSANSHLVLRLRLEETFDTSAWELLSHMLVTCFVYLDAVHGRESRENTVDGVESACGAFVDVTAVPECVLRRASLGGVCCLENSSSMNTHVPVGLPLQSEISATCPKYRRQPFHLSCHLSFLRNVRKHLCYLCFRAESYPCRQPFRIISCSLKEIGSTKVSEKYENVCDRDVVVLMEREVRSRSLVLRYVLRFAGSATSLEPGAAKEGTKLTPRDRS